MGDELVDGQVEIIELRNPHTNVIERRAYRWAGGARGRIYWRLLDGLGLSHARQGDLVLIGPYRIVLAKESMEFSGFDFVRVQYPWDAITLVWFEIIEWLRLIKYRVISTAAIWGMARIPRGAYPSWNDIGR